MRRDEVFTSISGERNNQDAKWGTNFVGRSDSFWLSILSEEVGEVAHAILEEDEDNLLEELVQCAAVLSSWLEHRTPLMEQTARFVERGPL